MSYAWASSGMADERKYWRRDNIHEVVLRDMVGRGVMNKVAQKSPKDSVRDVASATRSRPLFPHRAGGTPFDKVYLTCEIAVSSSWTLLQW